MTQDDFVNISVRLKPVPKDDLNQHSIEVISSNPGLILVVDKQQTLNFDRIFTEDSSQIDVYNEVVYPLVQRVKEGYNCTILAYGQTGTGKTYTMGTNPLENDVGVISRALIDFFSSDNQTFDVHVSFMEIYNEKVYDLLRNEKVPLPVRGLKIEGLSKERVFSVHEAKHFLQIGGQNRHTGETKQNSSSSRSHAIFSIHYEVTQGERQTYAKLNLVDLAGSESAKKTGTRGSSFYEGININKGLLCIGQVMTALSSNLPYIPYRQSIITTILQDSLSKNNYISLIACVKTGIEDSNETIQTLEFAQRVKKMKNRPEINDVLTKFKMEHQTLFSKNSRSLGTPLKRPFETPQRPFLFKRPNVSNILASTAIPMDNSKSVSSISSNIEAINFSPVLKKYMCEFENTVISKLETVIQNTLQRPRRSTKLISSEKENTPKYSWKQIEQKVAKLVHDEILQSAKHSRATSSPLNHADVDHAKMRLVFNSPIFEKTLREKVLQTTCRSYENLIEFEKSSTPVSPIINEEPEKEIFKKPVLPSKNNVTKCDMRTPRRSTRLSMKTSTENSVCFSKDLSNHQTKSIISSRQDSLEEKKKNVHCEVLKARRSARISLRRNSAVKENLNNSRECECKSIIMPKKTKSKSKKNDSPIKQRTKEVLEMINAGDKKQLQKLATIGPKTAERILLFRHFKGKIKSIKELAEMPGWSSTYFKNFIDQNFLKV